MVTRFRAVGRQSENFGASDPGSADLTGGETEELFDLWTALWEEIGAAVHPGTVAAIRPLYLL